jgi:DNA helicase-2/ATP-dependent DNA helicase PcrA
MGTFHSVFARLLRTEAEKLGYPQNFSIYDTDDAKSLLSSIIKDARLDETLYKTAFVYNRISSAKNNLIGPSEYAQDIEIQNMDHVGNRPKIAEIYKVYQERLKRAGAMDFDDLLYNSYKVFHHFPDVLYKYQVRFRYIMVDEYQDTNFAQYRIVKMLAALNQNLCVVGDDAQSIYAFRGANIQNILNFRKDYPDLKVFKLEQNYRSTKIIVQAANSLIANNKEQLQKDVWTDNPEGDKIKVMRTLTDNEEGKIIAQTIFEEKMRNQMMNQDFAILYRTNAQSRSIEEGLRRLNLPYRIYGGTSFYQRKEIKDMIAYLKLIVNPRDEEALKRIINYPTRGIGKVSIDKIIVLADQHRCSLWDVVSNIEQMNFGSGAQKIADFAIMIQSFMVEAKSKDAWEVASLVARQTGLQKDLFQDKTPEGRSRFENVEELLNGIKEFTERPETLPDNENEGELITDTSLSAFLQNVALLTDADKDDETDADRISLMTIHASKGLEFPVVIVSGMEEGLFPSQLSFASRSEMEEERRLFYVAITRAEKKLFLSLAGTRFKFGTLIHSEPSRFLGEIKQEFLVMEHEPFGSSMASGPVRRERVNEMEQTSPAIRMGKPAGVSAKPAAAKLPPEDPNFTPDDTSQLQAGQKVQHQKFGFGTVQKIEGFHGDRKATIHFDAVGEKQLILKYAKLKIV